MANNALKNARKPIVAVFFVLICLFGSFLPMFAPRTQAFLGIADFGFQLTTDVQAWAERILDVAAEQIAQRMIDEMVKSSITWANSGFDGNPAFVTDPTQYFGDIANNTVGGIIQSSRIGFLCSPLQNVNLKISLAKYYSPSSSQYRAQCTLTGIAGNIDNFYNHFDNGGWNTFAQMTQQPSNNPYGSFVDAQIQIDSQVASALKIQTQKLDWNQGFKSLSTCASIYHAPTDQQIQDYENGVSGPGTIASGDIPYNEYLHNGDCAAAGPDSTPGSIIKSGLDKVLPSGIDKLINVQHLDQLVSAFASGLLQRYVFGPKGLFTTNYSDTYNKQGTSSVNRPQDLECAADTKTATTDETLVGYSALSTSLGNQIDYIWQGEGIDTATTSSVSVVYHTPGNKTVSVTASSTDSNGLHHERTAACPNVGVSQSAPLNVSCSPAILHANFGDLVTWTAVITGGSGQLERLEWAGGQDFVPGTNGDANKLWPDGLGADTNDQVSTVGDTTTLIHHYQGGGNGVSTETIQKTTTPNGQPLYQVTVKRPYFEDKDKIANLDANITVVDKDPYSLGIVKQECTSKVTLETK